MRLLRPLGSPLFARFFAGQAVSQLGDWVFFVALQWHVIATTGSAVALGLVLGSYMAAQLVLLLAGGVISDRFPRRHVIVLSDVLQAALAGVTAWLAFQGLLTLPVLAVLAAAFGAAQAFAMPALGAFVPETVARDYLQSANALFQGTRTGAAIIGPAIGAGIVAFAGTGGAFALNAASFLVSAALLASAGRHASAEAPPPATGASPVQDVKDAVKYVARLPWLWVTILVFAFVNAAEAGPRNAVLPLFVTEAFDTGPEGVGLLLSAQGVGFLVGFLVLGSIPMVRRRGAFMYAMTVLAGAFIAGLAFAGEFWHTLVLLGARGVVFAAFGLVWETSIQDQVDPRMRGRVLSLDMLGSFALLPVAVAGSGVVAAAFGARFTFLAGGLLVLAVGAFGLVYGPTRRFTVDAEPE